MPEPSLPPTPAASLDITGKAASGHAPSISLGPAADVFSERSSATPSVNGSESSYHPASPVSPNMSKRKQSAGSQSKTTKDTSEFNLPPPPSRSRKIIQMKPKQESSNSAPQQAAPAANEPASTGKGGRKRASGTGNTAAGRKIARKTAHSLIERRRRSKMNEEFGVLKDMIPACRGQEMHKLAILQASIDYLRYLETCITDLKSNQASGRTTTPPVARDPDAMDEDPPSAGSTSLSPSLPPSAQTTRPPTSQSHHNQLPPLSHITTASSTSSPNFTPIDPTPRVRQFSLSTNSSSNYSPYILPQSNATSPVFSPQHKASLSNIAGDAMQRFSLTSPALEPYDRRHNVRPVSRTGGEMPAPNGSIGSNPSAVGYGAGQAGATQAQAVKSERSDREAMAALLMLNNDRRNSTNGATGWRDGAAMSNMIDPREAGRNQSQERKRGSAMSVRDLLSS